MVNVYTYLTDLAYIMIDNYLFYVFAALLLSAVTPHDLGTTQEEQPRWGLRKWRGDNSALVGHA